MVSYESRFREIRLKAFEEHAFTVQQAADTAYLAAEH